MVRNGNIGAIIVPHPPIILPEVGKGREREIQATIDAYRAAAERVSSWQPDVLIVSSPHAECWRDAFTVDMHPAAEGDFGDFGAPGVKIKAACDVPLAEEILALAEKERLEIVPARLNKLDHGTMIPLRFLQQAGVECPIVRIGLSGLPGPAHYRLGMCAARAAEKLGRRAVFIASGDLSHKLTEDGPYGFAKEGPVFDRDVTKAMAEGDFGRFLTFDGELCDAAAECGLGSFQIMAGALDGVKVHSELLSYEGPFGVGYGVAVFTPEEEDGSRRFLEWEKQDARETDEDPYAALARRSLTSWIMEGRRLVVPAGLPEEMTARRAGVFVSLHEKGELRGCIGTISPVTGSIAEEIIQNAVSAATEDPRFPPVRRRELSRLTVGVDVLGPSEEIDSPEELDVKQYGVIVTNGFRRGLLLPNLEGVDTPEQQIEIARRKAGIGPEEPYTLRRFQVVRHP